MSEYKLGLVEIYHPTIHGSQNPKLHTKYLYSLNIPIDSFMNDHPNGWLDYMQRQHDEIFESRCLTIRHPIIKNYNNIVEKKGTTSLEIIKPIIVMDDGYETYMCVIKTIWLRIFQRKWKQYYRNKILIRKNPKVLLKRQIYGKW